MSCRIHSARARLPRDKPAAGAGAFWPPGGGGCSIRLDGEESPRRVGRVVRWGLRAGTERESLLERSLSRHHHWGSSGMPVLWGARVLGGRAVGGRAGASSVLLVRPAATTTAIALRRAISGGGRAVAGRVGPHRVARVVAERCHLRLEIRAEDRSVVYPVGEGVV